VKTEAGNWIVGADHRTKNDGQIRAPHANLAEVSQIEPVPRELLSA